MKTASNQPSVESGTPPSGTARELFARSVLDAVGANIAVLGRDGTIKAVNSAWTKFARANGDVSGGTRTGVGVDYLAVVRAAQGPSTEGAAEALAGIQDVLAGRSPEFTIEYPCHSPDRQRWFMLRATPLAGETGGAVLVHIDVTERKQVEHDLQASETRYQRLFETAKDGILILDANTGQIVDVNPFLAALLGYTHAEFTGKHLWEIGLFKDVAASKEAFQELQAKGYVRYEDLPLETKDGRRIAVEFVSNVYSVNSTRVVQCNIRDITERRQARLQEQASNIETRRLLVEAEQSRRALLNTIKDQKRAEGSLLASEQEFRAMFEVASIGMAQTDPRTQQWLRVNAKMCAITGYSADEMLKMHIADLTHPEDRQQDAELFQRVVRGEAPDYRMEKRYLRKDGTVAWVNVNMTVIRDAANQPVRTMATIEDITERKQAEAEHEKLQAQFTQAQKMESVGRLAGGVAHDFNNLLMGTMGYTQLCLDKIGPEHPIREYLEEIMSGTERSVELTRQLLSFARKQIIAPKVMDLNAAIPDMLKLLRRLIGEDITMKFTAAADAWPVKMDPVQIDQILANLCVNARDAIDGVGSIMIETSNATFDEEYCADHPGSISGEYVLLSVTDTGCGMDRETLEHIFEPFFTTKALGEGTGLGLATVFGITKQNDGYINVYSETGKGTTFKIYLPRFVDAAVVREAVQTPAKPPRGTETVLLVEDEKSIRITTRQFLEDLGYTVLVAGAPAQALSQAVAHSGEIHLLITDVVMPGMSGRDLANHLLELRPTIKRLFISGFTADVIAQRGILDNGVNFLSKPFGRDVLARKVREVLEGKQG